VADFNGDGKADVLWRNTNGALYDWTMNGSQIESSQPITYQGAAVNLGGWHMLATPTNQAFG
ncbi:VCBS repeat-containing protein, partial [Rhodoblastus sp. 17X3]|uniref:FG-GAP repeat domain-containing protein n=1 Tax=Rhodoblastus sp. 17X3 TaxID=3047026 RepID=UPI0024B7B582